MYFIHRGSVDILSAEDEVIVTLHPGSFFGEMALLTDHPRTATVQAREYIVV